MTDALLVMETYPGHPRSRRLTMTTAEVAINADVFRWHDIDRIDYSATTVLINGVDVATQFDIRLGAPGRSSSFSRDVDTRSGIRTEWRNRWAAAVAILEQLAGSRLLAEAISSLEGGHTVTIGGFTLDRQGIHTSRWFGTSVEWREVAVSGVFNGRFQIFLNGQSWPAMKTSSSAWNVVLLPRIIASMAARHPLDPADAAELHDVPAESAAAAWTELCERVDVIDSEQIDKVARNDPRDVAAQCALADLEVVADRIDAGLGRLLAVVRHSSGADRERAKAHLLRLFAAIGTTDPAVVTARRELTRLG